LRLPRAALPGWLRYPLAVPALRAALAEWSPDVVDAHFVPNYGLMGALSGRRPLVVTAWGSDLLITGVANALQTARARFVLTRAAAVIADGENLAEAARRMGGGERVHLVPWGVDLGRFRARGTRERGLLFSARMHEPVYDLPTVLQGVATELAADASARLVIAGDGSLTPELERRAARVLPSGRYEFLGRIGLEAMIDWLGRAEIVISASRSDSTSQSLIETMACGAIPVVSDIEGNRPWVRDGEGARLFAPGDAAGLGRALRAARADPSWAEAARRLNRARVERDANASTNLRRIEQVFETLVARARGVAPAST
jgi:glycosyltransferase involved in cell wall biosynthesis